MTVISLINVKGGVGKTLTTINLAGAMAKQNKKVLLLDNDSQGNLSQILNVSGEYTMYDMYTNNRVNFDDCIVKFNDNIHVITNGIDSADLEHELHNKITREIILQKKYMKWNGKNNYDFILIDNSPFLGIMTSNAMAMSDYFIEVIDNSTSALQGLNMVERLVNDLYENSVNEKLKLLGIFRNRFKKRTVFNREFQEVIENRLNNKLFKTIVYDSVKYKEATALNKTIQEYKKEYSLVYDDLYKEILERISQ